MTLILTLKVMEFPDTIWQEGSPRPDEDNKKSSSRSVEPFQSYSIFKFRKSGIAGATVPPLWGHGGGTASLASLAGGLPDVKYNR